MPRLIDFFDSETTDIPDWHKPSDAPHQPHLVQIALVQVCSETRKTKNSMNVIVRPDGWKWDNTSEAFAAHGITFEEAMDIGVPEPQVVEMFMSMIGNGDYTVAHNHAFDARIIRIALKRYFPALMDDFKEARRLCTMWEFKKKMEYHKKPKLSEAYFEFVGEEMKDAHSAMGDVNAMMVVYWNLVDKFGEDSFDIKGTL